jgi:hypothetical protein
MSPVVVNFDSEQIAKTDSVSAYRSEPSGGFDRGGAADGSDTDELGLPAAEKVVYADAVRRW